jgi:RNA polymerase sigma-70 factor, ECF subfamily
MNVAHHFDSNYSKLHALAENLFRKQPTNCTLQATALVHEVYLRFADLEARTINGSEHFLAMAATAMRQILVDKARRKRASKRGGNDTPVTLTDELVSPGGAGTDVLVVHDLLTRLARLHERQARIVEMRVFADMTVPEIAVVLDVSIATIEKDWRQARAWIRSRVDDACS